MDFCTEVIAAALPLPEPDPDSSYNIDDVQQAQDVVQDERDRRVDRLRMGLDEGIIEDPLLTELAEARHERERADARIRRLVAYGRQFTRPRPYPLNQLARAAGMSISGVRTCYTHADTDLVATNIGRPPVGAVEHDTDDDPGSDEEADRD